MKLAAAVIAGAVLGVIFTLAFAPDLAPAQDAPAADADGPALDTDLRLASYGIGYNLCLELRHGLEFDEVKVDRPALRAGFTDALNDRASRVPSDELHRVLAELDEQVRQRVVPKLLEADPAYRELAEKNAEASRAYLAENGKRDGVVTLDSGVQYQVLAAGDGASPEATDTVVATFHGELADGTRFAQAVDKPVPIALVTPGAREVLLRMRVGDHWRVAIPPEMAHGAAGHEPDIGPNQVLIFDVRLSAIQPADAQPE